MKIKKFLFLIPLIFLLPLLFYLIFRLAADKNAADNLNLKNILSTKSQSKVQTVPEEAALRLERSLKDAAAENSRLRQEKDELNKKSANLETTNAALLTLIRTLRTENKRLSDKEKELDDAGKKIVKLEKKIDGLEKRNAQMSKKNDSYTKAIDKLLAENKRIKDEKGITLLEKEITSLKDKLRVSRVSLDKSTAVIAQAIKEKELLTRESALLHYNLGCIFFKARDNKRAMEEFMRSLQLNPRNPDAHFNLAIIYDDYLNDNNTAIMHYEKYLELKPDSSDSLRVKEKILQAKLREKSKVNSPVDKPIDK